MQTSRIAKRVSALTAVVVLLVAAAVLIGCSSTARLQPRFLIAPESTAANQNVFSYVVNPSTAALGTGAASDVLGVAAGASDIVSNGSNVVFIASPAAGVHRVVPAGVNTAGTVTVFGTVGGAPALNNATATFGTNSLVFSDNCVVVGDQASSAVDVLKIGGDNTLTKVGAPAFTNALGGFVKAVAVTNVAALGTFIYALDQTNGAITVRKLNSTTDCTVGAALAPADVTVNGVIAATHQTTIQADPNGKFVYIGGDAGQIVGYSIDQTTGNIVNVAGAGTALTGNKTVAGGAGSVNSIAFNTSTPEFLYSSSTGATGGVDVFPVKADSTLDAAVGTTAALAAGGGRIIVDRTNTLVYTSNGGATITGLVRNTTTGGVSGATTAAGTTVQSVALTY